MKFTPPSSPWLCFTTAVFLSLPLWSQDKPAPASKPGDGKAPAQQAAKPGGDPFVKKKGEAAAAAPVADEPRDITIVPEVVALSMDEYHKLIETSTGSAQLYAEIEKLKSTGQAKLETLMAATTHSGNRVQVEQSDEVRYATQWNPPQRPDDFPFPTAYEMRPVGQRFEVDPVEGPDGQVTDLSLALPFTRLSEFSEVRADPAKQGVAQPKFDNREITTAVTVRHGRPQFVGTLSHSVTADAGGVNMVRLLFVRVLPVNPGEPIKSWMPADGVGPNVRFTASVFSMDQATALMMLKNAGDPEAVHTAVMEHARNQKARLEHVLTCTTRSGQRVKMSEGEEFRYGTELVPPQVDVERDADGKTTILRTGKITPAAWTALETRPLGWVMEVDPVLNETGMMDVSVSLDRSVSMGWLQGHEWIEKRDPPVPLFETRKITTAVRVAAGRHALLGTFSPPQDTHVNGRKDDGRVWLAFLSAAVD